MASPSAVEKKALLDEVDKQLADLKLTPEERADIARPVVRIIGFDLYQIFSRTLQKYAGLRYSKLVEKGRSEKPQDVRARDNHSAGYTAWIKREQGQNPFERLDTYDLEDELERETPKQGDWMDDREIAIAKRFAREIISLYKGCVAKAGYTSAAAKFLDDFSSDPERKAKELYEQILADP